MAILLALGYGYGIPVLLLEERETRDLLMVTNPPQPSLPEVIVNLVMWPPQEPAWGRVQRLEGRGRSL